MFARAGILARIGFGVAIAIPPVAVAAYIGLDRIRQYPVASVLLALLYAAVSYALSFMVKVGKGVEAALVERATTSINLWIGSKTSRFEARYREYVASLHHNVDLKGTSTFGAFSLAVSHVFVDLALVPTALHEATATR